MNFVLIAIAVVVALEIAERVIGAFFPRVLYWASLPLGKKEEVDIPPESCARVPDEVSGYRASGAPRFDLGRVDRAALERATSTEAVVSRFSAEQGLLAVRPRVTWGRNRFLWVLFVSLGLTGSKLTLQPRVFYGGVIGQLTLLVAALLLPGNVGWPMALALVAFNVARFWIAYAAARAERAPAMRRVADVVRASGDVGRVRVAVTEEPSEHEEEEAEEEEDAPSTRARRQG